MRAPPMERRSALTEREFIEEYLVGNKPVIVTDAMASWPGMTHWSPAYLARELGSEKVQIYDDLFDLRDVTSLRAYLEEWFGRVPAAGRAVPYVRWYTKLRDVDFAWADQAFAKLEGQWELPAFVPKSSYLLPFCPLSAEISPVRDRFPARGLFLSARGARTRLHRDPWASDAILCQVFGEKKLLVYAPDQARFLTSGTEIVDIDKPDLRTFPSFGKAQLSYNDVLRPGEVVFFPRGWFHHVSTLTDSMSLTWNFVHTSTWAPFFEYLAAGPPASELEVIRFFVSGSGPSPR